jgi:hypothetical protein
MGLSSEERNMVKKLFLAFTAATVAAFAFLAVALGAVSNGSFETGPNPGAGFITLAPGSTAITGWTISGKNIDYLGSTGRRLTVPGVST